MEIIFLNKGDISKWVYLGDDALLHIYDDADYSGKGLSMFVDLVNNKINNGEISLSSDGVIYSSYQSINSIADAMVSSASSNSITSSLVLGINGALTRSTTIDSSFGSSEMDAAAAQYNFDYTAASSIDSNTVSLSGIMETNYYYPYIILDGMIYFGGCPQKVGNCSYKFSTYNSMGGSALDSGTSFTLGMTTFDNLFSFFCLMPNGRYSFFCSYPSKISSTNAKLFYLQHYSISSNQSVTTSLDSYSSPGSYFTFTDPLTGNTLTPDDILALDAAGSFTGGYIHTTFTLSSDYELSIAATVTGTVLSGGPTTVTSTPSSFDLAVAHNAVLQGDDYASYDPNIAISGSDVYVGTISGSDSADDEYVAMLDLIADILTDAVTSDDEEYKQKVIEFLEALNIQVGSLSDSLAEDDKDRDAVYGEILGFLESIDADIGTLTDVLGEISDSVSEKENEDEAENEAELDIALEDLEEIDSNLIIDKFPFSLPFDLYNILTLFVREPVDPVFTIPIKTEFNVFGLDQDIDEEITLDLTIFKINGLDIVQLVVRFSCLVGFVIMLIKITTKFFI